MPEPTTEVLMVAGTWHPNRDDVTESVRAAAYQAAAQGNPITFWPEGRPLRTLAHLGSCRSPSSPEAMLGWGCSPVDVVARGRLWRWWSPWSWRVWTDAVVYARCYLPDDRHTEDSIRLGRTRHLAETLDNGAVERASAR
ncbi:hypothetical protein ACQPXH_20785 [Nocardia sp. CA-135953]|uniref:hypothetical protein n=1 Tax=Nocardia sp. CA-135953 TaxID=3239978 RepID=UPI003D98250C